MQFVLRALSFVNSARPSPPGRPRSSGGINAGFVLSARLWPVMASAAASDRVAVCLQSYAEAPPNIGVILND